MDRPGEPQDVDHRRHRHQHGVDDPPGEVDNGQAGGRAVDAAAEDHQRDPLAAKAVVREAEADEGGEPYQPHEGDFPFIVNRHVVHRRSAEVDRWLGNGTFLDSQLVQNAVLAAHEDLGERPRAADAGPQVAEGPFVQGGQDTGRFPVVSDQRPLQPPLGLSLAKLETPLGVGHLSQHARTGGHLLEKRPLTLVVRRLVVRHQFAGQHFHARVVQGTTLPADHHKLLAQEVMAKPVQLLGFRKTVRQPLGDVILVVFQSDPRAAQGDRQQEHGGQQNQERFTRKKIRPLHHQISSTPVERPR